MKFIEQRYNALFVLYSSLLFVTSVAGHSAKDFEDDVMFRIDFKYSGPEKETESLAQDVLNGTETFRTPDKETYHCRIPPRSESFESPFEKIVSAEPSPLAIIKRIFRPTVCLHHEIRYWLYEVCHGVRVRQYHVEDKNPQKNQEFVLGLWDSGKTKQLEEWWEDAKKMPLALENRTINIGGVKYPYFEMEFAGGTPCELVNISRTTLVRYICHSKHRPEVYSIKELSTCKYEFVVSIQELCSVPGFYPLEEKSISCFSWPGQTHKPLEMLRQELSSMQIADEDLAQSKSDRDIILDNFLLSDGSSSSNTKINHHVFAQEFLRGKRCIDAPKGRNYWELEFCFGRYVRQYHSDRSKVTEVMLGYFSLGDHLNWMEKNQELNSKINAQKLDPIWHFYNNGSICGANGAPREVIVKLLCMPAEKSLSEYQLHLEEPRECEYKLTVQSPIVCLLKPYADDNGVVSPTDMEKLIAELESKSRESEVKNDL